MGEEIQIESALHVPGAHAAQCVQSYGAPGMAPSLMVEPGEHDLGHRHSAPSILSPRTLLAELDKSEANAELAACLATPMEPDAVPEAGVGEILAERCVYCASVNQQLVSFIRLCIKDGVIVLAG